MAIRRSQRWVGRELLPVGLIVAMLAGTLALVVAMHRQAAEVRTKKRTDATPKLVLAPVESDPNRSAEPDPPPAAPTVTEPPKPIPPPDDPTKPILAKLAAKLAEERNAAKEAEVQAEALENARKGAKAESATLQVKETEVRARIEELSTQAERLEQMADALARERDVLAEERDAAKAAMVKARAKNGGYAVMPHKGVNGTWQRPIVIECKDGKAFLQPSKVAFSMMDMSPFLNGRSPLIAGVGIELMDAQRTAAPDGAPVVPYIYFVVRPDGIRPYYEARANLERLGIAFGYEFVEQDWDIEFPDFDDLASWDGPAPARPKAHVESTAANSYVWPAQRSGGVSGEATSKAKETGSAKEGNPFIWPATPAAGLGGPGSGDLAMANPSTGSAGGTGTGSGSQLSLGQPPLPFRGAMGASGGIPGGGGGGGLGQGRLPLPLPGGNGGSSSPPASDTSGPAGTGSGMGDARDGRNPNSPAGLVPIDPSGLPGLDPAVPGGEGMPPSPANSAGRPNSGRPTGAGPPASVTPSAGDGRDQLQDWKQIPGTPNDRRVHIDPRRVALTAEGGGVDEAPPAPEAPPQVRSPGIGLGSGSVAGALANPAGAIPMPSASGSGPGSSEPLPPLIGGLGTPGAPPTDLAPTAAGPQDTEPGGQTGDALPSSAPIGEPPKVGTVTLRPQRGSEPVSGFSAGQASSSGSLTAGTTAPGTPSQGTPSDSPSNAQPSTSQSSGISLPQVEQASNPSETSFSSPSSPSQPSGLSLPSFNAGSPGGEKSDVDMIRKPDLKQKEIRVEVPLDLTVVCGPGGLIIHPGGYRITNHALKKDGVLKNDMQTIVRNFELIDPMVKPKPRVEFLVEPGGGEAFRLARGQTLFSSAGWPVTFRMVESPPRYVAKERF